MGFFSSSVVCGVCGNTCGLNRYKIWKSDAWACPQCMKKAGGPLAFNPMQDTIEKLRELCGEKQASLEKEYRMKCNVCGKVFCYTGEDLQKNMQIAKDATRAAGTAVLQSLAGTQMTASSELNRSNNLSSQIIDYSRCPSCNSKDVVEITESEWQESMRAVPASTISTADELRKFKELLDAGIITQEEFDAKKKKLLNL